jgi:hypothetical protein
MADSPETPEPFSLKRWSQRKRAAAREMSATPVPAPANGVPAATNVAEPAATAPPAEAAPLPPVESLTFESDFSAFMQPKVAEDTKRAALRKLFSDPSFNVMDGLDIYVGDYTQPDPMPAGMLEKLSAVYSMLDPVDPPRVEPAVAPLPASASDDAPAAVGASSVAIDSDSAPAPPVAVPDVDTAAEDEPGPPSDPGKP